jgi:hypothetical protein
MRGGGGGGGEKWQGRPWHHAAARDAFLETIFANGPVKQFLYVDLREGHF